MLYDLYIRFLATKGIDDLKEINARLSSLSLPSCDQKCLDEAWELIYRAMPKNIVAQIEKKKHYADFLRNMDVLGVRDMWLSERGFWEKDPEAKTATTYIKFVMDIHKDPWLRTCINALLMKKTSFEEISRILSAKFSVQIKERHLDIYSRYFFDTSMMTRSLWKSYIKRCTGREAHAYFTALTESPEVLKTELELPSVVNVSESLQWLLTKSFLKAKTYIDMGTVEAGREAREWIDQVVKLTDKYEKYRSGDQADFGKVLQMEFEFVEEEFASPDDEIAAELSKKTAPKETT